MSESATTAEPVTCERCAHLWQRTRDGFGVCACFARRETTGEVNPEVELAGTCEFAQLSAKHDPDFMKRVHEQRRQGVPEVRLLEPSKPLEDYDAADPSGTTCFID